ncbi:MAG: hypothetical protein ABSB41_05895 [Anaerolineales bacterium]
MAKAPLRETLAAALLQASGWDTASRWITSAALAPFRSKPP